MGECEAEKWTFDGIGRIVKHEVRRPGSLATEAWPAVYTTYNAVGWKEFVSERGQAAGTTFEGFDTFGRPALATRADGWTTKFFYTGTSKISRESRVWDGKTDVPATVVERYDGRGRLREVREILGGGKRNITSYNYDVADRLTVVNQGGQNRYFTFDGRGFLLNESHPENGKTLYEYDARGNVIITTKNSGAKLFSNYDAAGRLEKISSQHARLKEFAYGGPTDGNAYGKLLKATAKNWRPVGAGNACTNLDVIQSYSYDGSGRVSGKTTALEQANTPLEKWSQSYQYDGAGRPITLNYPNCIANCASTARQLTPIQYSMGRPVAIPGFTLGPADITYQGNGMLSTLRHANNVMYTQGPDANGMARPGWLKAELGGTALWAKEDYSYDGAGNITAIGTKRYGYDRLSRLVTAQVPTVSTNPWQGFEYDTYGNITKMTRGVDANGDSVPEWTGPTVLYDTDPVTNQITAASYSPNGSLLSHQGQSYQWDRFENLKYVNTGSEIWNHTYDADNERVWSWRSSSTRVDTYALRGLDGKGLRDYKKEAGVLTWEDYIYREGQLLASVKSTGATQHFDLDHLGSVRLVTNSSGAVANRHEFWPYGEEITSQASGQQMKFTGHERDLGVLVDASGAPAIGDDLDYMHARYYSPVRGRFLSVDPVAGKPRDPNTWNRYAYSLSNPIKYADLDGREVVVPSWLQAPVNRGNARSATFAALFERLDSDPRVLVTFELVQKAKSGTVLSSEQTVTRNEQGELTRLEQVVLVPVGAGTPENIGHEMFHGTEILDTGKTLKQRKEEGDKTVRENPSGWESDGAQETTTKIKKEISRWRRPKKRVEVPQPHPQSH